MSIFFFFFSSRRRHTRFSRDWSSDVCSSDLLDAAVADVAGERQAVLNTCKRVHVPASVAEYRGQRAQGVRLDVAASRRPLQGERFGEGVLGFGEAAEGVVGLAEVGHGAGLSCARTDSPVECQRL